MASPIRTRPAPVLSPSVTVLPLENGDHLTRDEFERRYEAMPEVKKAELIEGEPRVKPLMSPRGSIER